MAQSLRLSSLQFAANPMAACAREAGGGTHGPGFLRENRSAFLRKESVCVVCHGHTVPDVLA